MDTGQASIWMQWQTSRSDIPETLVPTSSLKVNLMNLDSIYNLEISGQWPILAALLFVALLLTWFVYKKTNPNLAPLFKSLLMIFRFAVMALLLLIIYESVLHRTQNRRVRPVVAVAIDNSASMGLADNAGSRPDMVRAVLGNPEFAAALENFEVKYYSFSNVATEIARSETDSLDFSGDLTDIAGALNFINNSLGQDHLTDIILISDGIYTTGINPYRVAEKIGQSIHTIGIGSPDPVPDLAVTDVLHNAVAYVNEPTPIIVTVRSTGLEGTSATLNMFVEGQLTQSKRLLISRSPSEITHEFLFTPEIEGQTKIEIHISPAATDQTVDNNTRTIYIDALKSKIKIALIGGSVLPEISFLKRALAGNERYEVVTAIFDRNGGFYKPAPPANFAESDIFLLIDFPSRFVPSDWLNQLIDTIAKKESPVLFLYGPSVTGSLSLLQEYLPFKAVLRGAGEREFFAQLSQVGAENSILKLSPESSDPSPFNVNDLPPVYSNISGVNLWPDAQIIAQMSSFASRSGNRNQNSQIPFLAMRSIGGQKSATIFAYGLWRWSLFLETQEEYNYYNALINNIIRWLEPDTSPEGASLELGRSVFNLSEPIKPVVRVFDVERNPVNDAQVLLKLVHNEKENLKTVARTGPGVYTAEFNVSIPGDYTLRAEVYRNSQVTDTLSASFTVGEYFKELAVTQLQRPLLESISAVSGGSYIPPDSLAQLATALKGRPKSISRAQSLQLWSSLPILITIIILLGLEWFLRKQKGLL